MKNERDKKTAFSWKDLYQSTDYKSSQSEILDLNYQHPQMFDKQRRNKASHIFWYNTYTAWQINRL